MSDDRYVKQVIVIRKDLNMRKGKMVAQGAHAAIMARDIVAGNGDRDVIDIWSRHGTTKICVGVDTGRDLLDIQEHAADLGIPVALVTDSGRTEFDGVPTITCLAVGPWWSEEIDRVTGGLTLL